MRINSNVSALNTHRNMMPTSNLQGKNLEKFSSGLDINRGADGPAKLQISEQLRAQTAGLKQAIDNSEMAVSVMQTAEAALDEVNRALVQARQLAVHAANTGTNDEFMQLSDQQELSITSCSRSTGSPRPPSTGRNSCWTAAVRAME